MPSDTSLDGIDRLPNHMCETCEDSGVVPAGDFADGETCPNCDGDPLNAVPHDDRPHPADYDCPDCSLSPEEARSDGGDS